MPDQPPNRRAEPWTLARADRYRMLARVRCEYCWITRHYYPADLQRIFGDVRIEHVNGRMRCEKCGRSDGVIASVEYPSAEERMRIRVRRLAEIKMVRKVRWRDE